MIQIERSGHFVHCETIQHGEEIFFNYRSEEHFTLSNGTQRRQTLQQSYNFTCQCPSCSLTGAALRVDRDNRREALQRFNDVSQAYLAFANDQQKNTHLVYRLQRATEYVIYLQALQITDGQFAWAYQKVAELHIDIWTLLGTLQIQGTTHCSHCRIHAQGWRAAHVGAARIALSTKFTIHIGILGSEHSGIKEDEKYMREISKLALES
jgi:hypothetical protein